MSTTDNNPASSEDKILKTYHAALLCFLTALISDLILYQSLFSFVLKESLGRVLAIFIGLFIIHTIAIRGFKSYKAFFKDILVLHLLLISSVFLIGIGEIFIKALIDYTKNFNLLSQINYESIKYAIPFFAGALLIQSVKGLHFGFVFSLSLTVMLTFQAQTDPFIIPYVMSVSLISVLSLTKFRSRSAFVKTGLYIALASLPFSLLSLSLQETISYYDISSRILFPFIGGFLCSVVASGFAPVLEFLGGYVTDIRLIEMSTLDHPLLKQLSIQAPGTWNHSMILGMMSEAAADDIGANPVLSRVGAYFHDIGKVKKPLYFIENQTDGENRHNKLSPSMSALIIRSHVKDGIELARQHKLPEAICDLIQQHHGTLTIQYFYDKAKKESEEEVDLSLYTYPGPKPQTREAGILMLADGIEPASRTLSDPSLDRLQGLVQKMINRIFASGELNECDLTLQDLHKIAKCFTRVLNGIYHQRIAYAEPAEKTKEKPKEEPLGNQSIEPSQDKPSKIKKDKEDSTEDLKRLGLTDGS